MRLIGQYHKMQRVGVWQTYNINGDLILEEDYNKPIQKEKKQISLLPI